MSFTAPHCLAGELSCPPCAVRQHRVDRGGIIEEPFHFCGDRAELGDGEVGQCRLEARELGIAEFLEHRGATGIGEGRIDADQIVGLGPRLQAFLLARQRFRIGFGSADFLCDRVGVVGQIDARVVGGVRLRHFFGAVAQRHDARRLAGDQRLRQRKKCVAEAFLVDRLAEIIVEFLRDVARQFEVLLLVFADRHMGRAVNQNVGRHQCRIGVETNRGILAILAGFFLELRHAIEPAEAGDAIEDPGELGVLRDLALVEHDVLPGIDPAGDESCGDLADGLRQLGRILPDRDRMQVDDAIDAVIAVLQLDEALDGAEIIAEMQVAGRLHAGKDLVPETP